MEPYQLDRELGRLAVLSRERKRRRMVVVLPVSVLAAIVYLVFASQFSDHSTEYTAASDADLLVDLLFVVALGVFFLVQAPVLRRSLRSVPGVILGLDKPWRRQVVRDLRAGTPNADPVLNAVEHIHAERLRRARTTGYWFRAIYGTFFLYWLARALLAGSIWVVVPTFLVAGMAVLEVRSATVYRNLSAFPWNAPQPSY